MFDLFAEIINQLSLIDSKPIDQAEVAQLHYRVCFETLKNIRRHFMQRENFVSLWLGNMKSMRIMEKYLKIKYSQDGDFIPSEFAEDFNIRRYDDDFREAEFYEKPSKNIYVLLEGFSYDKLIIEYLKGLFGEDLDKEYNTVILLYNFEYDDLIPEVNNKMGYFKFIGSTQYKYK